MGNMHMQEKRSSRRLYLQLKGCAFHNGRMIKFETRDISLGGTLVEIVNASSYPFSEGTKLKIWLEAGFKGRVLVDRIIKCGNKTLYNLKFDRFDDHSDIMLSAYFVKHGIA